MNPVLPEGMDQVYFLFHEVFGHASENEGHSMEVTFDFQ
jgi:hypothetical protein